MPGCGIFLDKTLGTLGVSDIRGGRVNLNSDTVHKGNTPDSRGEREFPTIPGNTGVPFPFLKIGNYIFHFRSCSQNL